MRILIGTHEVSGQLPDIADGFRRLGHEVTTVVKYRHAFYPHLQYDIDASGSGGLDNFTIANLIACHDVFLFQWDSLLPGNADYPLIRKRGKKIIVRIQKGDGF